jgi:hypothetical protein
VLAGRRHDFGDALTLSIQAAGGTVARRVREVAQPGAGPSPTGWVHGRASPVG